MMKLSHTFLILFGLTLFVSCFNSYESSESFQEVKREVTSPHQDLMIVPDSIELVNLSPTSISNNETKKVIIEKLFGSKSPYLGYEKEIKLQLNKGQSNDKTKVYDIRLSNKFATSVNKIYTLIVSSEKGFILPFQVEFNFQNSNSNFFCGKGYGRTSEYIIAYEILDDFSLQKIIFDSRELCKTGLISKIEFFDDKENKFKSKTFFDYNFRLQEEVLKINIRPTNSLCKTFEITLFDDIEEGKTDCLCNEISYFYE